MKIYNYIKNILNIKDNSLINNRKDVILLLLYLTPITGAYKLSKYLYLLKIDTNFYNYIKNNNIIYNFEITNDDAYCYDIYDDLLFLECSGYINSVKSEYENNYYAAQEYYDYKYRNDCNFGETMFDSSYDEYTYTLTNKGITYCQKIYDNMSFDVKKCLYNFNNKNLISLKSYQIKSLLMRFLNLNVYTS